MLWRLDPVLQRGHNLAAIASEQGWGIEPEPREYTGLEQPTRVCLHVPIRAILQDKPAYDALAQDNYHVFQHTSLLIVTAFPMKVNGLTARGHFYDQLRRADCIPILRDAGLPPTLGLDN